MIGFCYDDDWWMLILLLLLLLLLLLPVLLSVTSKKMSISHLITTRDDGQPHSCNQSIYQSINQSINTYLYLIHRIVAVWHGFFFDWFVKFDWFFFHSRRMLLLNTGKYIEQRKKERFCLESTHYSRDMHQPTTVQLFKVFADRCLRVGRAPFG